MEIPAAHFSSLTTGDDDDDGGGEKMETEFNLNQMQFHLSLRPSPKDTHDTGTATNFSLKLVWHCTEAVRR